jgi:hypothetical protein
VRPRRSVSIDSAALQDKQDAIKPESRSDRLDEARAAYVESFEQDHGPIDPQLTARFEVLFRTGGGSVRSRGPF